MKSLSLLLVALSAAPASAQPALHWRPVNEPGVGGAIVAMAVSPFDSKRVLLSGDMLGATVSTDGGDSWGPTFGFKGWEMGDFTFSPANAKEVWVGSMSGPYKSPDGGVHWAEKRGGFPAYDHFSAPVQKVLYDPRTPGRLLAFGGNHRGFSSLADTAKWGAVWESKDDGDTWALLTTLGAGAKGSGWNIFQAAYAADGKTLFVACKEHGVWKSGDGGKTWTEANAGLPNQNVGFLAVHPRNAAVLWCVLDAEGVYKSVDGGATWKPSNTGMDAGGGYQSLVVAPSNPDILFAGAYGKQKVWKSVDGGAHWAVVQDGANTPLSVTPFAPQPSWLAVDPRNANTIWSMNWVSPFRSRDGGKTWHNTGDAEVAGGKWRGRGFSGYVSTDVEWNPYNPKQAFLTAMDDGKFLQSSDDLNSWQWGGAGLKRFGGASDVAFGADGKTIFGAVGQFGATWLDVGIARSVDGGANWDYLPKPAGVDGGAVTSRVVVDPANTRRVWTVWGDRVYYTADAGANWREITVNGADGKPDALLDLAQNPRDANDLWLAGRGGVYRAKDGATFFPVAGGPTNWQWGTTALTVDPTNAERIYACNWNALDGKGAWKWEAGAWTKLAGDYFGADIRLIRKLAVCPNNPQLLAMCTNDDPWQDVSGASGVYLSRDGGAHWAAQNDGLPMLRAKTLAFSPDGKTLVVGLNGRGFYRADVP